MSSFDRRTFLISLAALGGCGFTPVYGPNGAGTRLRGRVSLAAPTDDLSYALTGRLLETLGPSDAPAYGLSYTITTDQDGVGITQEQETTRYQVTGSADYVLTDLTTGAVVASGNVAGFTGYSATGSTVSTLSAARDARLRLMTILADRITDQLIAKLA